MLILLSITVVIFLLLLLVAAIRPTHSKFNKFELERRSGMGDNDAKKAIVREKLLVDVVSLQRVLTALLIVSFTLLSYITFGWLIGILVAILVAIGYGAIARLAVFRIWSKRLYERLEEPVLCFVQRYPLPFKLLRGAPEVGYLHNLRIDSRQELEHLLANSESFLTPDQKKLVTHSLSFGDRIVSTIMTPRGMISSVKKSEFLGPLALNDLHQIGHGGLPVTDSDIDHIIGILNLNNLLTLDIKHSTTAEKAMDPKVIYIRDNQTLQYALTTFLRTRCHLLIAVDESGATVGLLTLTDVIEALGAIPKQPHQFTHTS